jgi:hypothetical protein
MQLIYKYIKIFSLSFHIYNYLTHMDYLYKSKSTMTHEFTFLSLLFYGFRLFLAFHFQLPMQLDITLSLTFVWMAPFPTL